MTRTMRVVAGLLFALLGLTACGTENGGVATAMPVTVTVTVTAAGAQADLPDLTDAPDSDGGTDATDIPGLQSDGTGVDPCALMTFADAQKLAATKLDPGNKSGQSCTYTGPVDGPPAQVQVFVGPGAKKQLDLEKQLGHPLRKLTGVGTESWAGESAVYVSKGALWVSVQLVRLNDPSENVARLEQAARTVAGRL